MRVEHWPSRLAEFLEAHREKPFAWGSNDCCLFAADGALAITGVDAASDIRGKYKTAIGASRILKAKDGVLGVISSRCEANGWKEIPPAMAQRGDVIVAELLGGDTAGIVIGSKAAFAGPNGIHLEPIKSALHAWRIT